MTFRKLILTAAALFLSTGSAWTQGTLIIIDRPIPLPRPIVIHRPAPPVTYTLKEIAVHAKLVDQVANVQVSQTFHNPGSSQMQVQFVFPLPYDGAIDSLTLMIDGKEFPAKLLSAKEARERYEAIVRTNKDPALLEYVGQGMFQTSVFPVPAGAERQISLSYTQLLRKDHGLLDFLFPLSTAKYTSKPVEKVNVQLQIESSDEIKNVYSPTHAIEVKRTTPKRATISWTRINETPSNDFRLYYDVGAAGLSAKVITYRPNAMENGYFLLLASPPLIENTKQEMAKTVLFVVDRSGSMSGKKIEQVQKALKFVLDNLREGDLFNIFAYENSVEAFRPELQRFTDQTRKEATGFIEGLYAGGGTNIHAALMTGLAQLQDSKRPAYVLFLTDGLPTVGQTDEAQIADAAKSANKHRARLLPFGVGYDVNSRLLDRLARDNFGMSEFVRPDEDIEAHVARVYSRISSPVMTDVELSYEFDGIKPEDAVPVNRQYPKEMFDLFAGEQLVIVGRYTRSGAAKIKIRGKTESRQQTFDFPAEFVEKSPDDSHRFVEKLWATRRIGEIIDQLDLHGKNEELLKELVELSTSHGILTPYTSFLADENARPDSLAQNRVMQEAAGSLRQLEVSDGKLGLAQRAEKLEFQAAARPAASFGGSVVRDVVGDREVQTNAVRGAANETLYAKGFEHNGQRLKLLVTPETAQLDLKKDKSQIVEVERFSDQYFELVRENSRDENMLFVQQQADEQLLVALRGQTYLIK